MPCFYFHLTSKENNTLDDNGKELDTLSALMNTRGGQARPWVVRPKRRNGVSTLSATRSWRPQLKAQRQVRLRRDAVELI